MINARTSFFGHLSVPLRPSLGTRGALARGALPFAALSSARVVHLRGVRAAVALVCTGHGLPAVVRAGIAVAGFPAAAWVRRRVAGVGLWRRFVRGTSAVGEQLWRNASVPSGGVGVSSFSRSVSRRHSSGRLGANRAVERTCAKSRAGRSLLRWAP